MDNNQSKGTEQSQNTVENNDELSFKDVVAALESGNSQDLDRLMAVDGTDDTTEEDKQLEKNTDDSTVNEDDSSQQVPNKTETSTDTANPAVSKELDEVAQLKLELHRLKSDAGRVPAMQRQLAQLQSELRAAQARSSSGNDNRTAVKEPELPDNLKRKIESLREIDPEVANTMEEMYKATAGKTPDTQPEDLRQSILSEIEQRREEEDAYRFQQEQLNLLGQYVPRYADVFALPQWRQWKDTLTPGQRAMAESAYAQDVVHAINAFGQHMQATMNPNQVNGQNPQAASSEGGDPNANTNAAASASTQVTDARNRKVEASPTVRGTAAKATEAFDESQFFKEQYANITKQIGVSK
jgi:hypothetical protein